MSRGGKREGAGRPKMTEETVVVSVRMPKTLKEEIEKRLRENGGTVNEFVVKSLKMRIYR